MEITYKKSAKLSKEEVLDLYSDVGWVAYTTEPDTLMEGIQASLDCLYPRYFSSRKVSKIRCWYHITPKSLRSIQRC